MEPLYFQSCEEVDTYFREGREYFNETYVKKLAQVSTYFTRLQEQTWPLNTGTTQRGFRFGRGFFDPTKPWRRVNSKRCAVDSCDSQPDKIIRPGTSSYFFELITKELITDWICVEDLMYRLLPVEEIMQFEESNARITRTVHEEIARTTYIGAAGHKWGALVNNDNEYCGMADDHFFFMEEFDPDVNNQAGFDSRYIYVKCAADQMDAIAKLSLTMLDDALEDLGDEDESYRMDMREQGSLKLDVIVPEQRVARQLWAEAKVAAGYYGSSAGWDGEFGELRLGMAKVIGDYAFGFDGSAWRGYKDAAYNDPATGGPDGTGLDAFDENDSTTWPRIVRVPKYIEQATAEIGYEYVPNPEYRSADFGISILWNNNAITKWRNPSWTGTDQVQMDSQNYAGDFEWQRPHWECNRKKKSGFFDAEFRLAMQVKDPTVMHAFLHRLDQSRNMTTSACPVREDYTPPVGIDVYVCQGVQPSE